jgi:hypothetical protein
MCLTVFFDNAFHSIKPKEPTPLPPFTTKFPESCQKELFLNIKRRHMGRSAFMGEERTWDVWGDDRFEIENSIMFKGCEFRKR